MSEKMTISRLAGMVGVNIETIRFYQRRGLIVEPARPYTGYRTYEQSDASRLRFIKRAQALGFTLDEIAGLLRLEGSQSCVDTRSLAVRKLAMVKAKLADLRAMETALSDLIGRCDDGTASGNCPIIHALAEEVDEGTACANPGAAPRSAVGHGSKN